MPESRISETGAAWKLESGPGSATQVYQSFKLYTFYRFRISRNARPWLSMHVLTFRLSSSRRFILRSWGYSWGCGWLVRSCWAVAGAHHGVPPPANKNNIKKSQITLNNIKLGDFFLMIHTSSETSWIRITITLSAWKILIRISKFARNSAKNLKYLK